MTFAHSNPFKSAIERDEGGPLHPGEILREDLLPHYRMERSDLAARLGIPLASVDALLEERSGIDVVLAARLGEVFALSAQYWRAIQLQYDLWQTQDAVAQPLEPWPQRMSAGAAGS